MGQPTATASSALPFGWLKSSPATFILAVLLLVLMFVAPFGIVGLLKRLAVKLAVIVPSPGWHP